MKRDIGNALFHIFRIIGLSAFLVAMILLMIEMVGKRI